MSSVTIPPVTCYHPCLSPVVCCGSIPAYSRLPEQRNMTIDLPDACLEHRKAIQAQTSQLSRLVASEFSHGSALPVGMRLHRGHCSNGEIKACECPPTVPAVRLRTPFIISNKLVELVPECDSTGVSAQRSHLAMIGQNILAENGRLLRLRTFLPQAIFQREHRRQRRTMFRTPG